MRWGSFTRLGILLVLALLAGCAGETAPEPAVQEIPEEQELPEESALTEMPEEPEESTLLEETAVGKDEAIYERPAEEGPSISKFLDIFKNNVNNYRFRHRGDQWIVEGKNAKIQLSRVLQNQYHAPYLDTIYLDLERKTAIGICEGITQNVKKQCVSRQVLGQKYALPYLQFKIILPEDWLFEFQNRHVVQSTTPHLITDRETAHLKHQTQTRTTDFYIDPSSGLPLAVIDNGAEYHYEGLVKNQLKPGERTTPAE